jgi:hypothetical protein
MSSRNKKSTIKKKTYADMASYISYANVVKLTKKKQKKKAQKEVPWTLVKSVVKFKRPITKKRKQLSKQKSKMKLQQKQQKKLEKELKKKFKMRLEQDSPIMPNIYLIIAHSAECHLKDIDTIMNSGTLKPIKILEKAAKKYTTHKTQFLKDAESLRNYEGSPEPCHRYYKNHKWTQGKDEYEHPLNYPYKNSLYFCEQCLKDSSKDKYCKYFWCDACSQHHFEDTSKSLHKPIKIDTRINLDTFIDEYNHEAKGKLKVLMGQSPGRSGFMSTYYKIIEKITDGNFENNEFLKLLFDIIDTDKMETKIIDRQMTQLNKTLNVINPKFKRFKYHDNKTDTDFRLYPRMNKKTVNGKTTRRLIHGPHDFELLFEINKATQGRNKNGDSWPLGVYNLKTFSSIMYNKYFMNKDINHSEFFNIIKDTSKYTIFPKSLLLKVDKPKQNDIITKRVYSEICRTLDINPSNGLHTGKVNPYAINRYNVDLYNKHFVPKRTPLIKLSELMKIVLEQDGYLEDNENKKPEAIFITNICRGVMNAGELTVRVDHTRNTTSVKDTNTTISGLIEKRKANSDEA